MSYPSYPASAHVPKPGVIPLRPLSLGDILSGAFATIRTRPALMLGMTAIVVIVAELIILAATYPLLDDVATMPAIDQNAPPEAWGESVVDSMAVSGLGLAIVLVTRVLLSGFATVVVGTAVIGRPQTIREAWTATRPRVLPLLGLTLVFTAVVAGAVFVIVVLAALADVLAVLAGIAAVVVGIWLTVLFAFATTALVLEHAGIGRAFGRSRQLVRGSWWRVFGILLLVTVMGGVVVLVVYLPFLAAGGGLSSLTTPSPGILTTEYLVWTTIGAIVSSVLVEPFIAATTVLLYTDQRIRREGLADELARTASA